MVYIQLNQCGKPAARKCEHGNKRRQIIPWSADQQLASLGYYLTEFRITPLVSNSNGFIYKWNLNRHCNILSFRHTLAAKFLSQHL